jgi:diadenylate cyclase
MTSSNPREGPLSAAAESRRVVEAALVLARSIGIAKLLVRADLLADQKTVERLRDDETIVWLTVGEDGKRGAQSRRGDFQVRMPSAALARFDQVRVGLTLAVLQGAVDVGESVVCLTGLVGSKRLDNIAVANPARDIEWLRDRETISISPQLMSRSFVRILEIATRLAAEGREGKPIGTTFIMGDPADMEKYTRPLILNPCKGHRAQDRSVHNPAFFETLRELSAVDGAFIVDRRGVVCRAGVYLGASLRKKVKVDRGLGARHAAAAALTGRVEAVAFVVSESSGKVTVYADGGAILKLEQPGRGGPE